MIVHKTGLDYKKHCTFATGTYVQANHDDANRKNTNAPRTLDGIYLRYNTAHQGGHEILHLPTYKIMSRSFCTKIPMTKQVIDHVSTIGSKQGIPTGLKIENRYKTTLYDSDWIAGVDYADMNDNNEDSDTDSDESEGSDESKDSDRSEDSSDDNDDNNLRECDDIDQKDISDLMENNQEEKIDNFDDKNYENTVEENVQESVENETTEEEEYSNENDIPEITTRSGRRVTRPTRYPADNG